MWGRAGVIAAALGAALVPVPPQAVERYYSNGVYPPLQRAVTGLSNAVPFALFDAALVGVAGWWVWRAGRDAALARRDGWRRPAARVTWRTATTGAALYLLFAASWGFNYRRLPVTERVRFDEEAVTAAAARELALRAVQQLNALHASAHASFPRGGVDASLAPAFARAQAALGSRQRARPARPKGTLIDPYFAAAGVEGMTNPFFLETLVARDLLPFERPFVIAHEWGHLAGLGDEGEANLAGWVTCMLAADGPRYSGWLFLYRELASRLSAGERRDLAAQLAEGPRGDLRAIAERARRNVRPAVSRAGWRVYDGYLKANRVEAGAASYAEVVRLVLGTGLGRR